MERRMPQQMRYTRQRFATAPHTLAAVMAPRSDMFDAYFTIFTPDCRCREPYRRLLKIYRFAMLFTIFLLPAFYHFAAMPLLLFLRDVDMPPLADSSIRHAHAASPPPLALSERRRVDDAMLVTFAYVGLILFEKLFALFSYAYIRFRCCRRRHDCRHICCRHAATLSVYMLLPCR